MGDIMKYTKIILFSLVLLTLVMIACAPAEDVKSVPAEAPEAVSDGSLVDEKSSLPEVKSAEKEDVLPEPSYIGRLATQEEGDVLLVAVSFFDENKDYTVAKGTADIRLESISKETVYEKEHEIDVGDCGEYTMRLTGEDFIACTIEIPYSDIEKAYDYEGYIFLSFVTENGASFEELKETTYDLPEYTEEEILEMSEKSYLSSVRSVDVQKKGGSFRVTVEKSGLYTSKGYDGFTDYFRIDFKVENIGTEKEYFFESDMVLLDGQGRQYDYSYDSEFEGGELYPGVVREGYVLFEDFNKESTNLQLIVDAGYDDDYDEVLLKFNIPSP
ncbi:MAG: DUF4352 domain-containing protein [Nanoarchaeota archaeon]|nr:DUF4352 domain-containing protein [Nanoarchaeota archaeon]